MFLEKVIFSPDKHDKIFTRKVNLKSEKDISR